MAPVLSLATAAFVGQNLQNKKLCGTCLQIGDQGMNILVNYILNVGVIGGCEELCGQLPSGGGKQTACELVCGYVGIKTFISVLEKADLDSVYGCSALGVCQPGDDDAAIDLIATHAEPNPVMKGDTVEMQLGVNVTHESGLGEFFIDVEGPMSEPVSQGFRLMDGVPVGEQILGVKLQIQDQHPEDPTQPPFIWSPGQYNFTFRVCQGECGSKHPHSIDFGRISGTFDLHDAVEV
jgi:hypothetical protein